MGPVELVTHAGENNVEIKAWDWRLMDMFLWKPYGASCKSIGNSNAV